MLFASWWLLATQALVDFVGASIAAVGLGVIGASILRGLHLPLRLWPDGPWRGTFSSLAVVGSGVVVAALVWLSNAGMYPSLHDMLDPGTGLAVVAGTLAWGFAVALVRQRSYWRWFGLALAAGLGPYLVALLVMGGSHTGICFISARAVEPDGTETLRCAAPVLPSLLYVAALGTAMMLVTEEVAFRRVLLGGSGRTGAVSVIAAAIVAFLWYGLVARAGEAGITLAVLGGVGALGAGSLYVLSRSLLVSALYSGSFTAGYWALTYGRAVPDALPIGPTVHTSAWLVMVVVVGILLVSVYRRHGLTGDLLEAAEPDAAGD